MPDPSDIALPNLSSETLDLYLSPYLDGELNAQDTAEVERLLQDNPEAAELCARMRMLGPLVQSAYSDASERPIPIGLASLARKAETALERAQRPAATKQSWSMGLAAAACVALIAVGLGSFSFGRTTGHSIAMQEAALQNGWIAQIVKYHQLYSQEDRHLVEVTALESDHIQAWLGNRIGLEFDIPDLTAFGYTFAGARLLAVNGEPTAQLMFRSDAGGLPLGFCFLRSGAEDAPANAQTRDGLELATWTSGGVAFIVVGADDRETASVMAESISQGIDI